MNKILEFISSNIGVLSPVAALFIGILVPTDLFKILGVRIRTSGKIPRPILEIIVERLDAFEYGLLGEDFRGDNSIIGNSQLSNNIESLKKDLESVKVRSGLEE